MPGTTDKKPTLATSGNARASPARGTSPARAAVVFSSRKGLGNRWKDPRGPHLSVQTVNKNEIMLGAFESGMLALALGANMCSKPINIDELMDCPKQKPAAWTPRTHEADLKESMFASLAPPRGQTPMFQRVQARAPTTERSRIARNGTHQRRGSWNYCLW